MTTPPEELANNESVDGAGVPAQNIAENAPQSAAVATKPGKVKPAKRTHGLSKWTLYRRRFMRNKPAVAGLIIFALLVLIAFFGSYLTKYDHINQDFNVLLSEELRRPHFMIRPENIEPHVQMRLDDPVQYANSGGAGIHFFGTDSGGHDLFARTVQGLKRSLMIAVLVSFGVTAISAVVGTTAAYLRGTAEKVILAIIHFLLVIPNFLIIALLVNDSGGDWKILVVVLVAFGWMFQSRVIWSLAMSVREREYVAAAKYMGVSTPVIILRHMIPNIGSLLVINLMLGVVGAVMTETGLSFLGLGVKIPDVSLGTLLEQGAGGVLSMPWTFWVPAGTLTLLTVSMALVADGLRDALDPNSSAGGTA